MTKLYKDYWEFRELVKALIPRRTQLEKLAKHKGLVKEKGRKVNYSEFNFEKDQYEIKQKLLNKDEITSFLEVSLRAAHCPMPLNADVWDGLYCSYGCKYCLPPTSKILMYDGKRKSIGRIKKGERVISYNITTNEIEISTVTDNMRRNALEVVIVKSRDKTIKLTLEHPVFTKRGWIEAGNLTNNDEVLIW